MSHSWRGWERVRFVLGHHGQAVYPAGSSFGPRTLGDFELVWIIDGDVTWICDGVDHPAPPGTVILARPGMREGYRWDARRDSRHGYVHLRIDLAGADCPPVASWPLMRRYDQASVVPPLLRHLLRLLDDPAPACTELAQGAARQILLAFLAGGDGIVGDEADPTPPPVARVLARLREVWRGETWNPLSVSALAHAAGVSREHLARLFQRHFGASPRAVQLSLRLDRGAHLLARTSLPVNEVARVCGFSDQFHFSRCFRAAYRGSPRLFRQRIAAGEAMPAPPLLRVRNDWHLDG